MDNLPQAEIASVARSIVAGIAPEELMLFRMQSEAFFRDPKRATAPPSAREDAMGFGAGDALHLVTPFVLAALTEVGRAIRAELLKQIGEQTRAGLRAVLQRLSGTPGRVEALSREQLQWVRDIALQHAGPDPVRAGQIADGIVAALCLQVGAAPGPRPAG